jgi:hypothetical protein
LGSGASWSEFIAHLDSLTEISRQLGPAASAVALPPTVRNIRAFLSSPFDNTVTSRPARLVVLSPVNYFGKSHG